MKNSRRKYSVLDWIAAIAMVCLAFIGFWRTMKYKILTPSTPRNETERA